MHAGIFKAALFFIVFHCGIFAKADELAQNMHQEVERYTYTDLDGQQWQDTKTSLANYTPEQVANALIADIDADRGRQWKNHARDVRIGLLYKGLNLPTSVVCAELEKNQTPQRKASLLTVLDGNSSPEVTAAILKQLKDRRPAVEHSGGNDVPVYALRVCDVACNVLSHNLETTRKHDRIDFESSYAWRDEIIKQTLGDLNLTTP